MQHKRERSSGRRFERKNEHRNKFLEIFEKATKHVEKSKKPSLHAVWPWKIEFDNFLTGHTDDSSLITAMKKAARDYIHKSFTLHGFHQVAVFLHPKMKGLKAASGERKIDIYRVTRNLMDKFSVQSDPRNYTPEIEPAISSNSTQTDTPTKHFYDADDDGMEQNEINEYRDMVIFGESNEFNLFGWWFENKAKLPNLYRVACFIHSIPASSSPSQRSFSVSGNVVTKKRASLKSSTLDEITFLHSNMDMLRKRMNSA